MEAVAIRGRRTAAIALLLLTAFLAQGLHATEANAAARGRQTMFSLTNADRAARDRATLSLDVTLSKYAKKHSRDMAKVGHLYHTSDLASKLSGLDWSIGGENVGVGSSLDGLERAFMRSKPHRQNILRTSFDHSAIGVYRDGKGTYWVTVIFYG
jgi:uncharacterized protein YkwD